MNKLCLCITTSKYEPAARTAYLCNSKMQYKAVYSFNGAYHFDKFRRIEKV